MVSEVHLVVNVLCSNCIKKMVMLYFGYTSGDESLTAGNSDDRYYRRELIQQPCTSTFTLISNISATKSINEKTIQEAIDESKLILLYFG